nr:Chain C, GLY-ARG-ALA-THR-LYS-SER-ILE-PRO-PRO-ILE-ALA-PHE-PRO-ASP [Helianthus annuus]6U24_A Chain A, GLY-ARG-ALA-THR-LYS-SER-ILE-PRO-PRO-ILE-ALA-PHE-PRO-ASP [Helianthus annuus]
GRATKSIPPIAFPD